MFRIGDESNAPETPTQKLQDGKGHFNAMNRSSWTKGTWQGEVFD
jgi:hypothetical protein